MRLLGLCAGLIVIVACASPPAPPPAVNNVNLDAETQTMIAQAQRVVFVVPFSQIVCVNTEGTTCGVGFTVTTTV